MASVTQHIEAPDPAAKFARATGGAGGHYTQSTEDLIGEKLILNMGPSHPATHGVLRLILELDGEVITRADPDVGFLHRGDEKIAENMQYNQFVPYTDRLDYLAPLANNVAYALAVEKLMGWELPERGKAIRVICCELARISAHLLGLGAYAMDVGAMTVFLYTFQHREIIYNLSEQLTGARFTTSYTRIGGQIRDLPEGFTAAVAKFCEDFLVCLDEVDVLLTRNKIFLDRTKDVGIISKQDAIAWGLSGPNLRGSGVEHDLRKAHPYLDYERYDFDIPIGEHGDSFDRYLVRMEEMRQSVRILRQVLKNLPGGPINVADAKQRLPKKENVLMKMEELIHHFILVTEGLDAPEGEVYFGAENPKGELGFYICSKGGGVPYRLKIRAPSFVNLSILSHILPGHMMSDVVAILGSLDFVMGECDR
jgi:NADH-quinone oxidoreductase subunit D